MPSIRSCCQLACQLHFKFLAVNFDARGTRPFRADRYHEHGGTVLLSRLRTLFGLGHFEGPFFFWWGRWLAFYQQCSLDGRKSLNVFL